MVRPLVIIHGWSDKSASFRRLARLLRDELQQEPIQINLANYISMDDEVMYEDLVTAMMRAWQDKKLPETPGSVDAIVHSTGGLIIRDWISRYYKANSAPLKHLVMLAPANFGSALAHKGRSFIGRVVKGFSSEKFMQTGAKLLKGLELASPYTWDLAMKDRFGKENYYGKGKILCTVLIGDTGYSGISAAVNESGSDGTVRASAANMECALLEIDFNKDPLQPSYQINKSKGQTGFAIIPGENHSTIAAQQGGPKNPMTLKLIKRALQVTDDYFPKWCRELTDYTHQTHKEKDEYHSGYQNTVFFVHDQFDSHVKDYFLEFTLDEKRDSWLAETFHTQVIQAVHPYEDDPSYRSLYIDCHNLEKMLDRPWDKMDFSLTAMPAISRGHNVVGYRTFTDDDIGGVEIHKDDLATFFSPHRTVLIKVKIRREQLEKLFELQNI